MAKEQPKKLTAEQINARIEILKFCKEQAQAVLNDATSKGSTRLGAMQEYKIISFEILDLENTSAEENQLLKEIERLRKENSRLTYEIGLWKDSYGDIYAASGLVRGPLPNPKPEERSPDPATLDPDPEGLHREVGGVEA